VAGLSTPPVQSAVRTIYPKLVNARQLTALFSLDASLQEIIWILAPVVITLVATQVGTVPALLLIVVILVGGGAWFILSPEVGRVRIPRSRRAFGKVLGKPVVLLATVIGFLLIGACAPSRRRSWRPSATAARGGPRPRRLLDRQPRGRARVRPHPHGPLGDGGRPDDRRRRPGGRRALRRRHHPRHTVVGEPVPPRRGRRRRPGARRDVRDDLGIREVQRDRRGVRLDRHGSADRRGPRLGVAGFLIDDVGPAGAYAAAAGFAILGAVVAAACVRGFLDLRGRDASPIPDTEPVPVIT
jgi:hypothetical protein